MEPFSHERIAQVIARATLSGVDNTANGMARVGDKLVARAKERAGEGGSHAYGTPTPASPGKGPAVISGDFRRSIARTEVVKRGYDFEVKVGPQNTPHGSYASRMAGKGRSPRGSAGRTSSNSKIGLGLETGGRHGPAYPFLGPALKDIAGEVWQEFKVAFTVGWL